MRLIFLGTASAFVTDTSNYQSNMLLQSDNGEMLLIDCGSDARRSLHALGYHYQDIRNVYISHLHADHSGGLEWLAFSRRFDAKQLSKPNLYVSADIVQTLWKHTLSGGLTSLSDEHATLSSYFVVHSVPEGGHFNWQKIRFHLVKNIHILTDFAEMPSYGLFFHINDQKIFITTDTQFQPEKMHQYYEEADFIFQDCETNKKVSGVHAHYRQLKTLDLTIKNKMWLYHYNSTALPDAKADGFAGFVLPGQTFNF